MGATSSHHEPLDKSRYGGSSFRRANSMRHSKKGSRSSPRRMEKLRRSFRESFRRRKEQHVTTAAAAEQSKPHMWQNDELDVRSGTCFFHVKYLGCVEVFESRGMQVCEEALKVLKNSRRRPVKAVLYVSGDGLRVVEDDTKGLIVDQTIEKVSFCAPDRSYDRGFSYICRDGTTRRWMCHGFLAVKESGERLSHAVGCAFAVCLERKQKRDKECSVTMNFDVQTSTFTRTGSFRQPTLTERLHDATNSMTNVSGGGGLMATGNQNQTPTTVININNNINTNYGNRKENIPTKPAPKCEVHPIERPHATISMLERQGSFRGLSHLNQASPFKRQLSLRVSELPSNLERARSHSLEYSFDSRAPKPYALTKPTISPIPEHSPTQQSGDNSTAVSAVTQETVNAMCKQLSFGLSLLSNKDDYFDPKFNQLKSANISQACVTPIQLRSSVANNPEEKMGELIKLDAAAAVPSAFPPADSPGDDSAFPLDTLTPPATPPAPAPAVPHLPRPDQWLGKQLTLNIPECAVPPKPKLAVQGRAYSLGTGQSALLLRKKSDDRSSSSSEAAVVVQAAAVAVDPFNVEWTPGQKAINNSNKNTNPFLTGSPVNAAAIANSAIKAFEVQM